MHTVAIGMDDTGDRTAIVGKTEDIADRSFLIF
jgi:hypothetical protein